MLRFVLILTAGLAALASLAGAPARAQCILANPSFELEGSGGPAFAGWNQFGVVGVSDEAAHGSAAALCRGPNSGAWDVSGFWQQQDCQPYESWDVTVRVMNPSSRPLTGTCAALVNIEWHDAAGEMISYESHVAANAASPSDTWLTFTVTSDQAPVGTVATRLLLGVLQGPTDTSSDAIFDQATFHTTWYPTIDDVQWYDFSSGTTLDFAGHEWRVKGPGYYGPGPSHFSDSEESVWVDAQDRLHMTIRNRGGIWYSTEVVLSEALGYGDYIFTTYGDLDLLDPHDVLGLFIWQYAECYSTAYLWWNPYNEFDIEYSRWGNPGNDLGQFVAQPWDRPGNMSRYAMTFEPDELTSHAFRWLADRVECRAWRGGPHDESPETLVHEWTYTGPHIPRPEQPRVHINLWQFNGPPATDQEVILDGFLFVPEGASTAVHEGDGPPVFRPAARLLAPRPNPFNPSTELRFVLDRDVAVELTVFDLSGRRVRTLVDGSLDAGEHTARWNGRDARGMPVASGAYLCVLRAGDVVESRSLTLVK